ncbi:MAG TPA: glycosyltransferase family 39 protein [Vicinamibacterales bacterium]|nr:glycosyltransferase family 39 protein [Vicinamibacterales bacterium]
MRRVLLTLSIVFLAWAALVVATGGIQWRIGGVLLRSRDPGRALAIGFLLLVIQALVFRGSFARDTERITAAMRPWLAALAVLCAVILGADAIRYGSFTAGGSDSFGYVSQAYGWASGQLPRAEPLPFQVPWPSGDLSLAPLGYRPGPSPHTMVPTYAPGLPLLMAAALVFGACGPFLVVPACAALVGWLTFDLGRRTAGPWAGVLAAAFAVTSPIVVFMSHAPMSDVPAAALWTAAAVAALRGTRPAALAAGLLTAVGFLVRPNLPALPLVIFAYLAFTSHGRERWIRLALFTAAAAPAPLAIAALNTVWYGAPSNSGYGAAAEIYSVSNLLPNLARYPVWLWQSHSPLVLLALVPLLPPFTRDVRAAAARLCAALVLATLLSYLVYMHFEEWWYLRFLLPAIPALLVLVASGIVIIGRRVPRPWGHVAVAAATVFLVNYTVRFNVGHGMFDALKDGERRYADVGVWVARALPPDAVIFSLQQSGSLRFYGGRMTIRWDLIDRDWTRRAPAEIERLGFHPYMVIEDWELPQMREWFGLPVDGAPPWPLVARMREHGGVNVFDLSSRATGPIVPVALTPGEAPHCSAQQPLSLRRRPQ